MTDVRSSRSRLLAAAAPPDDDPTPAGRVDPAEARRERGRGLAVLASFLGAAAAAAFDGEFHVGPRRQDWPTRR
jgi:hypothetical protein